MKNKLIIKDNICLYFSKFYEPTAILADPVNGPLVANLLGTVNMCCIFVKVYFVNM
jgi:hypothetical protein